VKQFRYPARVLYGDYLRSGAGLFVGVGVLLAVPPSPPVIVVFGSLAALFAAFGLRTLHRHGLRIAVSDEVIACRGAVTTVIPWREIATMKLRYFGSRRSKWRPLGSGFMQLTLKGPGAAMTFESSLEGFDWLAGRAAAAMRARGLALDAATASNLIELGIDPQDPGPGGGTPTDGCGSPPNVL
jgi:hypothetical protein